MALLLRRAHVCMCVCVCAVDRARPNTMYVHAAVAAGATPVPPFPVYAAAGTLSHMSALYTCMCLWTCVFGCLDRVTP